MPDLPSELVHQILNEACNIGNKATLSSIALTSHSCRIISDKSRFAIITIRGKDGEVVAKTHELCDLIKSQMSGPPSEMTKFVAFIKSFSTLPSGSNYLETFNDGSLAFIMRNLFLPPEGRTLYPPGTPRHFCLKPPIERNESKLPWPSLVDEFKYAFSSLCRESLLTSLSLGCIVDLPRGLLCGSNINELDLHWMLNAQEIQPIDNETTQDAPPVLLENLKLHHRVSLPEVLNLLSKEPMTNEFIFSRLKKFHCVIRHEASQKTAATIFSSAKNLEDVTVYAFALKHSVTGEHMPPMNYSQISQLKCLTVHLDVLEWKHASGSRMGKTLITLIGNSHPPSLMRINIIVEHFLWMLGHRNLYDLFKGFLAVDLHLSNIKFSGRIIIHVRFGDLSWNYREPSIFMKAVDYLRRVFHAIQEKSSIESEFIVN